VLLGLSLTPAAFAILVAAALVLRRGGEKVAWWVGPLAIALLLAAAAVAIVLGRDVKRNPRVPDEDRQRWFWTIMMIGIIGMPLYVLRYCRRAPVESHHAPE
jgi:hypothetical protein